MAATAARRRKLTPEPRPGREAARRARARVASPGKTDRRTTILEAATRRFAQFGFESTTVRQIGDDVNILSGSLYHHFATKDEMLHEIVREAVQQMRNNALRIARAPVDAERRLTALILLDLGELTRNQKVHAILTNERRLFRQKEGNLPGVAKRRPGRHRQATLQIRHRHISDDPHCHSNAQHGCGLVSQR